MPRLSHPTSKASHWFVLAVLASGCSAVLGIDDFSVDDTASRTDGGGATGGVGPGGAGGSGGAAASSGTAGSGGLGGDGGGGSGGDGGVGPGGVGPGGVGPGGGPGGVGPGGVGGGTGGGPTSDLGSRCDSDGDCDGGLFCVRSDSALFDGQGPAFGICTADCTGGAVQCASLKPGALCVAMGASSYCFEGCSFGPTTQNQFSINKCHGRPELACSPLDAGGTIFPGCLPNCNSDADCAAGFCDRGTGMCASVPPPGLALNSPCSGMNHAQCLGNCGQIETSPGMTVELCTERCTVGAFDACGWDGSPPADGLCIFSVAAVISGGGPGVGDLGLCGQACDCTAECRNPAMICAPWGDDGSLEAQTGKAGFCGTDNSMGELTSCAN